MPYSRRPTYLQKVWILVFLDGCVVEYQCIRHSLAERQRDNVTTGRWIKSDTLAYGGQVQLYNDHWPLPFASADHVIMYWPPDTGRRCAGGPRRTAWPGRATASWHAPPGYKSGTQVTNTMVSKRQVSVRIKPWRQREKCFQHTNVHKHVSIQ